MTSYRDTGTGLELGTPDVPTVQRQGRNGSGPYPKISKSDRCHGQCQKPVQMEEIIKIILDCRKESGQYTFN